MTIVDRERGHPTASPAVDGVMEVRPTSGLVKESAAAGTG